MAPRGVPGCPRRSAPRREQRRAIGEPAPADRTCCPPPASGPGPARPISVSSSAVRRLRGVHHHQRQVGIGHRLVAALDAQRFHQLRAFADAGGIEELHRNAADGGRFGDQVAGGAGDVGDDGAVLLQQAVEEAALADVRTADDGEREAVRAPGRRTGSWRPGGRRRRRIGARRRRISSARRDADVVLGEVDAGFEQRDQFEQLLLERRDAARDRAVRPAARRCAPGRAWWRRSGRGRLRPAADRCGRSG